MDEDFNFKVFLDSSGAGFFLVDKNSKIVWMNKSAERLIGTTMKKLGKKTLGSFVVDKKDFSNAINAALRKKPPKNLEVDVLKGKRTLKASISFGSVLKHDRSNVVAISLVPVSEAANVYKGFFDNSVAPIIFINDKREVVEWNSSFEKMIKLPKGKLFLKDFSLDKSANLKKQFNDVIRKGHVIFDTKISSKNGPMDILVSASYLKSKGLIQGIIQDITEKKSAQGELKESEEKFRVIFENAADGMFLTTEDFKFVDVNPAYAKLLKYKRSDLVGKSFSKTTPARLMKATKDLVKEANKGKSVKGEWTVIDSKSNEIPIVYSIMRVNIHGKKMNLGIVHDISYIKKTEEKLMKLNKSMEESKDELEESKTRYKSVINSVNDGIFILDKKGVCTFVNPQLSSFLKMPIKKIIGMPLSDFLSEKYKANALNIFRDSFAGASSPTFEVELVPGKGKPFKAEINATSLIVDKHVAGIVGVVRDLRAKALEARLSKNEKFISSILNSSGDAIISIDNDRNITSWNLAAERLFGYTPKEAIGKNVDVLTPASEQAKTDEFISILRERGAPVNFITERITKSKETLPVELTISSILDENNNFVGITGIVRDIRDRLKAEVALEKSEKKYRTVVEAANDGIFILDNEGKILFTNSAFKKMIGADFEIVGRSFNSVVGNRASQFDFFRESYMGMNTPPFTINFTTPEDKVVYLDIKARSLDPDSSIKGILCVARDVTEHVSSKNELERVNLKVQESNEFLKKANEELRSLDTMKDEFLSVASHELKTPLTSIKGYVELALESDPESDNLKTALQNANQLERLINEILDISKIEGGKVKYNIVPVSLEKLAKRVVESFRPQFEKKEIKIDIDIDHSLPEIEGDFDRLTQVLSNLIDNSIKFTEAGGRVSLEARKERNKDEVIISVNDTGIGIDQIDRPKIFSKFFQADSSSSRSYGGTGLGLSIAKGIVEGHSGKIWVTSAEGIGSTFSFSLPFKQGSNEEL